MLRDSVLARALVATCKQCCVFNSK